MTTSQNRLPISTSNLLATCTSGIFSPVRRPATAGLACLAATLLSAAPVLANPKGQVQRDSKACLAEYDEALKTALALKLAPAQKQARVDVIYNELAACLRTQRSTTQLPKRPIIVATKPVAQKPAAQAPARKKSQWVTQPAPQTGTNIR